MRTLRVGGHELRLFDMAGIDAERWGRFYTETVLSDGAVIPAAADTSPNAVTGARDLGYGDDTAAMSRDHEIGHALLAHLLGLPESPTLRGVADKRFWPHWRAEEAAVLALQRYARAAGVGLVDAAERLVR